MHLLAPRQRVRAAGRQRVQPWGGAVELEPRLTYIQRDGVHGEIPRVPEGIVDRVFNLEQLDGVLLEKGAIFP